MLRISVVGLGYKFMFNLLDLSLLTEIPHGVAPSLPQRNHTVRYSIVAPHSDRSITQRRYSLGFVGFYV